jgi:ribonucleotide reductase beta subunit family protein with ferritin-like domain
VKQYIRYHRRPPAAAAWGLQPIYGIDKNPLPWLDDMLNGDHRAHQFLREPRDRVLRQGLDVRAF